MSTQAADPAVLDLEKPAASSPRIRRFIASTIDAGLLWVIAIIWFHWVQWAQYTDTFVDRWPAAIAMPVMMVFPITALWLEAVSSRGLGKLLTGLRVVRSDGENPSLRRMLARSILKWSPLLIGPIALLICQLAHSNFADVFASDRLVPWTSDLADILPGKTKAAAWMLEQAARTVNVGAIALTILALGEIPSWFGKAGMIDTIAGTRVIRRFRVPRLGTPSRGRQEK